MRNLVSRWCFLALLFIPLATSTAWAQSFLGGIRGAVKDSNGVIPGAQVVLTEQQTGATRTVETNQAGEYVFSAIPAGTYTVQASLTGFKTFVQTDLRIGTQQFLTLDVTLDVGSLEETITVTGQAALVETSNASTGTLINTETMAALPSAARTAFMMGTTVPTVVPSGDTQYNRQQDQTNVALMSLGGGARRGNNYTLDGVPITDMRNRASAHPSIESLEDVKVQVHTYDAEMGRTGGGVFNTTLKSGTNNFRGTGFYQVRPIWGQTNNYFSELAGRDKPNSPYRLAGGAIGGPIVKNRTFFWFTTEGYDDTQTRNTSVLFPTAAMRAGDFSAVTNGSGQPVTIYDPLTGQPFPGNQIPASRINPVAANMLRYLPTPDTNRDDGSDNYTRTSLIKSKYAQLYSVKLEHKITDNVSLSGFYLYNKTQEPCANYFGSADQNEPNRFADPNDYYLVRKPQILAINNTWVLNSSSVLALRFGKTDFPDDNTLSVDFDPRTLGFSQTYANQIQLDKFPQVRIRGYDGQGRTFGAINPTEINWKSTSANATYSKLVGSHTFKAGGDWRKIGVDSYIPGDGAGFFDFDKDMTSSNGGIGSTTDGNSFASFLLGYPSSLSTRESLISASTPLNLFTHYFGGFVQDDWRVSSKLTVNYGVRLEHEKGLSEENNNFTVGWDPAMTSALSTVMIPADAVAGTPARTVTGGLMYAGVDGNKTYQGDAPGVKWSPRIGVVYSFNPKTVLRGGYGTYWAPLNFAAPSSAANNYGQVGYSQNTILSSSRSNPTSLSNPFPTGIALPTGNAQGALTNLNSNIGFVDQNRTAPKVQQYSVDLQRELGKSWAMTVSYMGARGDNLTLAGADTDVGININQLDPKYLALGSAALDQQLPNPFFGNSNVPLSLSALQTLSRARLLLPHPQYGQINARQVTEGYSRYNAGVIEFTRRLSNGFGGRFNYTYSVLKDNQFGEANFYQTVSPALAVNNYNYVSSQPACGAGQAFTSACYDPSSEYGYGIVDVPHRLNIAPIFELPFGLGKKWANNNKVADYIIGGWMVSATMSFQSGFPINIQQVADSRLGGQNANRPNLSGADLATPGDYYDRLASADHPTATWINPAAFTLAPAGTFGNTPRTITDIRTPGQRNIDASFIKNIRFAGTKTAQFKMEVINLLNRPNVRSLLGANTLGNANFGRTNTQAGFMRQLQFMFRFSF